MAIKNKFDFLCCGEQLIIGVGERSKCIICGKVWTGKLAWDNKVDVVQVVLTKYEFINASR